MFNHLSAALTLLPRRLLASSPRTLTAACRLLSRMEAAVVRCLPGDPKLTISFCLEGSHKHMLRDQDEQLGKVLARISNGIAKSQGKAKKSKKNREGQQPSEAAEPTVVKLYHHGGEEVPETVQNSEAWQDGAVLQVGNVKYSVQRNPPTLTTAELPVSLLAGFPVCPKLEVEFGNLQDCEFTWFNENRPDARSVHREGVCIYTELQMSDCHLPWTDRGLCGALGTDPSNPPQPSAFLLGLQRLLE